MGRYVGWVWVLFFTLVFVYLFNLMDVLPDHLAVHFDVDGQPNGFQDKADFIPTFAGFVLLMNGIFFVIFFFLQKIPIQFFNMPGKDRWLSSEGLKALAYQRLKIVLCMTGIYVNVVYLFTEQVIYQSNTKEPSLVLSSNIGLGLLLGLLLVFIPSVFYMCKPPAEKSS